MFTLATSHLPQGSPTSGPVRDPAAQQDVSLSVACLNHLETKFPSRSVKKLSSVTLIPGPKRLGTVDLQDSEYLIKKLNNLKKVSENMLIQIMDAFKRRGLHNVFIFFKDLFIYF